MNSEINRGETLLNQKKSAFLDASLYALIFLLLGFIVFFYFLSFVPITGESMENTMYDKQYCLVLLIVLLKLEQYKIFLLQYELHKYIHWIYYYY